MLTEKDEVNALKEALRHVMIQNLKLRMHMSVLITTPSSKTARKIATEHNRQADFSNSIIHLN